MSVTHVDEFIDELLREERVCDIMLPRVQVSALKFAIIICELVKPCVCSENMCILAFHKCMRFL